MRTLLPLELLLLATRAEELRLPEPTEEERVSELLTAERADEDTLLERLTEELPERLLPSERTLPVERLLVLLPLERLVEAPLERTAEEGLKDLT